jgi:hypothetical protein
MRSNGTGSLHMRSDGRESLDMRSVEMESLDLRSDERESLDVKKPVYRWIASMPSFMWATSTLGWPKCSAVG